MRSIVRPAIGVVATLTIMASGQDVETPGFVNLDPDLTNPLRDWAGNEAGVPSPGLGIDLLGFSASMGPDPWGLSMLADPVSPRASAPSPSAAPPSRSATLPAEVFTAQRGRGGTPTTGYRAEFGPEMAALSPPRPRPAAAGAAEPRPAPAVYAPPVPPARAWSNAPGRGGTRYSGTASNPGFAGASLAASLPAQDRTERYGVAAVALGAGAATAIGALAAWQRWGRRA